VDVYSSIPWIIDWMNRLHSGRTYVEGGGVGLKFDEWDIEGFKKQVMGQFMKFLLQTTPGESNGDFLSDTRLLITITESALDVAGLSTATAITTTASPTVAAGPSNPAGAVTDATLEGEGKGDGEARAQPHPE
jgi:hypothetical protein